MLQFGWEFFTKLFVLNIEYLENRISSWVFIKIRTSFSKNKVSPSSYILES